MELLLLKANAELVEASGNGYHSHCIATPLMVMAGKGTEVALWITGIIVRDEGSGV